MKNTMDQFLDFLSMHDQDGFCLFLGLYSARQRSLHFGGRRPQKVVWGLFSPVSLRHSDFPHVVIWSLLGGKRLMDYGI